MILFTLLCVLFSCFFLIAGTFLFYVYQAKKRKEKEVYSLLNQQETLLYHQELLKRMLREKEELFIQAQQQFVEERGKRASAEEKASHLEKIATIADQQRHEIIKLTAQEAALSSQLTQERQQTEEKLKLLLEAQTQLKDTFKALSAEALSVNNHSFLTLASSTFERFQEVTLIPLNQTITKVDTRLADLEKVRVGAYEALRQQVGDLVNTQKELRLETTNLVKALRTPTVRGQWGEMQLKRVVEMAGMVAHCDFIEQGSVTTENGRFRPDMIVNLPGNKKLIIDSKAPLSSYLEALEADNDKIRKQKLADHARQVRSHIRLLSQRGYWEQFEPTPEFVILFLPGETFFSAALEHDPTLLEVGVREKVILAAPTTLIALLRAVAYGWRHESLADNARMISALGHELYKRLSDMGGHMSRLGRCLNQALEAYNQTVGTLERRVLVSARKIKELDKTNSLPDLMELNPIQGTSRPLQSTELENTMTRAEDISSERQPS